MKNVRVQIYSYKNNPSAKRSLAEGQVLFILYFLFQRPDKHAGVGKGALWKKAVCNRHSVQCFLTAQYPVSVNFPAVAGDHYLFHLFEEKTAGITDCVGPVVIFYAVCSTYVAHHKAAGLH